jgi:hypothetical protein
MVRDEELIEVAKKSYSVSDTMNNLGLVPMGGNHKRYKQRLNELGVKFAKRPPKSGNVKDLSEYLVLDGPGITTSKLRIRLIKAGLKKEECEKCGQGALWNNEPLKFHLDHINGNNRDNRLENLRILCPNCHCQTPTYARIKKKAKITRLKQIKKCECGKTIQKRNKTGLCKKCYLQKHPPPRPRKVTNRPPTNILLAEIKELGYRGVGRKYGVSDRSVRKWIKK